MTARMLPVACHGTFHVEPMTVAAYVEATRGQAPWQSAWQAGERRIEGGPCWEAWAEGEVAAVAGLELLWPGVAQAWAVLTDAGRRHPLFVARQMRARLMAAIAKHGLHRVQCDVAAGHVAGYLLVDWLGFQEEGIMRGYGVNREDHVRYARLEAGL